MSLNRRSGRRHKGSVTAHPYQQEESCRQHWTVCFDGSLKSDNTERVWKLHTMKLSVRPLSFEHVLAFQHRSQEYLNICLTNSRQEALALRCSIISHDYAFSDETLLSIRYKENSKILSRCVAYTETHATALR